MSDIGGQLNRLLRDHDARLAGHRQFLTDHIGEFLKEAYRINEHIQSLDKYLRSIRQPYLSTSTAHHRAHQNGFRHVDAAASKERAHFTDQERDQIDAQSKATLREINLGIQQLEGAERIRKETSAQIAAKRRGGGAGRAGAGFRALGRWAAGGGELAQAAQSPEEAAEQGREWTLGAHRESVIWFLRRGLEAAARMQSAMMETRLEREIEKSKSVLYKTKGGADVSTARQRAASLAKEEKNAGFAGGAGRHVPDRRAGGPTSAVEEERDRKLIEQTLSPEQLQLFAEENNELLKQYEDTLDQVRNAERSMLEISELQTTIAQNLEVQSTQITQLVADQANTEGNLNKGNKELKKASQRWRPAQTVFYVSCGLSAFLVVWDFVI